MDLVQHLESEYLESLPAEKRGEAKESAQAFVEFCRDYLRKHPPRQVYYPSSGLGLVLANHVSVAVSPESGEAEAPGGMQPSGAVPVTGQETLRDIVKNSEQSMEQVSGPEDRSRGGGPIDYKSQSR